MFYSICTKSSRPQGTSWALGPGLECYPQQLAPRLALGVGLEPHLSGLRYPIQGCVPFLALQGQQLIL